MKQRPWLLPVVLVVCAGLLHGVLLSRQSLWVDESFSLAIATGHSIEHAAALADPAQGDFVETAQPVPAAQLRGYAEHGDAPAGPRRVVRAVFRSDTNPPLYYLLLNGWTRLVGTGDVALRGFSALWALACIPILVTLARAVKGERAALAAGVLFVVSPPGVYYATEGRMYSLVWFWALLTAWSTWRLHSGRATRWTQAGWVFASAGGLLTHYFFFFPWAAFSAFLLLRPGEDRRLRLILRGAAVGLLILPWYLHLPASLQNWRITQDWITWEPAQFNRWAALRDLVLQFFSGEGHYLWRKSRLADTLSLVVFTLLAGVMAWRLRRTMFLGGPLLFWLWLLAACAGPVVFDLARHTYTVAIPRYAISALPAAMILAGIAVACLGPRLRWATLALLVGLWGVGLSRMAELGSRQGLPVRSAARYLDRNAGARDVILVHSIPSGMLSLVRYLGGAAPVSTWVGQLGVRTVPESIQAIAAGRERLYFVKMQTVRAETVELAWLDAHARRKESRRFGDIEVTAFELRPPNMASGDDKKPAPAGGAGF